ncbi:CRISPR-associated endonuclease Cas1, partial [Thermogladius sp.]|uniref:CRISPR-associated endonuclease Cas1 n=1 Tax=Thermogladius sp. TaxID=2023064 RepID=UPI003D125D52
MRDLVVSEPGTVLRFRKGVFVVEKKGSKTEVPPLEVERVFVASSRVGLSSKVLLKAVEYGIDVVLLDSRGVAVARVHPLFNNKLTETRKAQYRALLDGRWALVAREVVYSKVMNQAGLLKRYYSYTRDQALREGYEKLSTLASEARLREGVALSGLKEWLRSVEAEAARVYWGLYATLLPRELGFQGRDQEGGDPVNASLNYAYGILYSESYSALVIAGLDPYAGFLHEDRPGSTSLVFDFIEQFRFIADAALLDLLRHGWRTSLSGGLLDYESRRRVVAGILERLEKTKTRRFGEAPVSLRGAGDKKPSRGGKVPRTPWEENREEGAATAVEQARA